VTYKVLKDRALRELLRECGLSTDGSRQQLTRRHEEYILLCVSSGGRAPSEHTHEQDFPCS